jgi:hypothetical protein
VYENCCRWYYEVFIYSHAASGSLIMMACCFKDGKSERITIVLLSLWLYYTTLNGIYMDIRHAFNKDAIIMLVSTFLGFNYELYVLRDINYILI